MKTHIKNLFLLSVLMVSLGLMLSGSATAQTLTTLHSFTAYDSNGFNSDGVIPEAGLILSGNTLYGTAAFGGSSDGGTVFAVNTNGTGFTTLHSFSALEYYSFNSDGQTSLGGLVLSGNTLYGTAEVGGTNGGGTVFAVSTNGTGFTTLHNFAALSGTGLNVNSDGFEPFAGLILSGNTLYGTAINGGNYGFGTVFAVNTNGTGFTVLHSFADGNDGALPSAGLVLSGNTLYGTVEAGGTNGGGTVFAVNTDGTGFTNLYSFGDEDNPHGRLVLSGNTLYGTAGGDTVDGGSGEVFAINTNGTGFTNLYIFTGRDGDGFNNDGFSPNGVILSSNTLYGVAIGGGSHGYGTVFAVNTNGTRFTTLYSFTGGSDGAYPDAEPDARLILSGNTLYGTTYGGGIYGNGTVFSLTLGSGPLVNVQFAGYDGQATKTGAAAIGFSGDYWNVMPALDGEEDPIGDPDSMLYGSIECYDNLGNTTPVTVGLLSQGDPPYGLPCGFAIGTNAAAATDPLMQGFETEDSGAAIGVSITGLDPHTTYDIYLYGVAQSAVRRASQFQLLTNSSPDVVTSSSNPQQTDTNLSWNINVWQEGKQYVAFRNVHFTSPNSGTSRTIAIQISGTYGNLSVVNGLQIFSH